MSTITAGSFVRIISDPYANVTELVEGEAYPVISVSRLDGLPELYEVNVPNNLGSDTFPYYESELELVEVSEL
jgi:hypothetical protein